MVIKETARNTIRLVSADNTFEGIEKIPLDEPAKTSSASSPMVTEAIIEIMAAGAVALFHLRPIIRGKNTDVE